MSKTNVINFQEKRKENIEKKRRTFERVLFQNFLGAYTVIAADDTVYPVSLVDISHDGCLFQIPWDESSDKKLPEQTELKLRMYFTKDTFIPTIVHTRYAKIHTEKDGRTFMRYGCEFDKTMPSFHAMKDFINFMYSYAEHSAADRGDAISYFL